MANLNKVMLIGNIGNAPEQRQLEGGNTITLASLATNEYWKDKNGEQQTRTEWHNLVFFGRLAETASKYLNKGSPIFIEGRLRTRKWEGENGITRYATQIHVDRLQMLGKKEATASEEKNDFEEAYQTAKNGYIADAGMTFDDNVQF